MHTVALGKYINENTKNLYHITGSTYSYGMNLLNAKPSRTGETQHTRTIKCEDAI